jgi:hypothetical protein
MKLGIRRSVCAAMLFAVLAAAMSCTKALNDSQVSEQIRAKLNQDSGLQGKSITVETSAGVVTLSGTVDNDAQRTAAARYASTTQGIKEVVNNLQVAEATTMPARQPMADAVFPASTAPVTTSRPAARRHRTKSSERNSPAPSEPHSANGSEKVEPAPATTEVAANQSPAANAAPSSAPPSPPPPPAPKMLTIQSGTSMAVRLIDPIDSETAQVGQTFHATLDSPLSSEWEVAIPAGYNVEGHIVGVKSAGKFAGQSELVLQLDRILVGKKSYTIQTDPYRREGKNRTTNTAEKVGAGAVVGAIIGGIAGGGKGAGIGAAAGAGVGGGVQAATKGQQIKLPSETVLNFTLQSPLTVMQVEKNPEAGRRKLEPAQ